MKNIYLIGMPGCGKSTIGKHISKILKRKYIDLDEAIESATKLTIKQLFDFSENHFRQIEAQTLKGISNSKDLIVATGGGIITKEINIDLLSYTGFVIYINRPLDEIVKDIDIQRRPLLNKDATVLFEIYAKRKELYERCAHVTISNCGTIEDVINNVVKEIKNYETDGH